METIWNCNGEHMKLILCDNLGKCINLAWGTIVIVTVYDIMSKYDIFHFCRYMTVILID